MTTRKLAMTLAGAAGAVLVVMAIIGYTTGATQEVHEHFAEPEVYAMRLLDQAGRLVLL